METASTHAKPLGHSHRSALPGGPSQRHVQYARSSFCSAVAQGGTYGSMMKRCALGSQLGMPCILLKDEDLDLKVRETIPAKLVFQETIFPLKAENGDPIVLLRGDGKLGFKAWPQTGLTHRWSLAAMSVDLLGLGRPQLYVANDFGDKDLWRFEPDGGMTNLSPQYALEDPGNGMSVDVGDVDGDGRLDLYVANMFSKAGTRVLAGATTKPAVMARLQKFARGNSLYLSEADGGYTEAGESLGVNRGLWAYGSLLADLDDDGRLEVAVANGFFSHPKRKDL